MSLIKKLSDAVEGLTKPKESAERKLIAKIRERETEAQRVGPPEAALVAFKKRNAGLVGKFELAIPQLVTGGTILDAVVGAGQVNLESVTAFMMWAFPEVEKKLEAEFLKTYPKDWVSDEERQRRLTKLDGEIHAINVELCGMYGELIEANLDFVPIEQIEPGVFLGLES